MNFSRTFPKAALLLTLVITILFVSVQPAYALDCPLDPTKCDFGSIVKSIGDSVLAGPVGIIVGATTGYHVTDIFGGVVSGLAASLIKGVASLINSLIFLITVVLFEVGGELIKTALVFNSKIGTIAEAGYNITLGLANMGFIVALVVIAFATMFRQEGFGYKKALPRVIIAALLINFGFFIITKWFIAPVDSVTTAISSATHLDPGSLGKLFSVDNLFQQFSNFNVSLLDDAKSNIADIAKTMMSVLLAATFGFIGIISLFAMAIMLFIRGIALSILLILLPIAWVMWIFPNLKLPGGINPWTMWWENFTRWLLFAPLSMFFLWLAISLANTGELFPDASTGLYSAAGQMIVTAGLILGGLLVSNKMGITGAAVALSAVAAGKVWAQSKAKRYGLQAGRGTIRKALPKERLRKLEKLGSDKGFFGKHLAAPARAVGRRAVRGDAAITKAREAEFREKIKDLAPFQVDDMYAGLKEEERAYALKYMIEKGYDWELNPQARKDVINWAKKGHFDNNVYGLKKAELDLVDTGVSPNAMAAQAEYKESYGKAAEEFRDMRAKGAPKSALLTKLHELRRIKFEGQKKLRETYYKELNVIPAAAMSKLQRRMFSAPKVGKNDKTGKMEYKTPYTMFAGSPEGVSDFLEFQDMLVDYLHEERPSAVPRVRGAVRGDGAARITRGTKKHLTKFREDFLAPLIAAEKIVDPTFDEEKFAKERDKQFDLFASHWGDIQTHRITQATIYANKEAGRQGLTPAQRDALLAELTAEIGRMMPEQATGNYQQLLIATRGATHATFSG